MFYKSYWSVHMSGPLTVKCINPSNISFFRRFLNSVFIIFTLEAPFSDHALLTGIVSTSSANLVDFGHMCSYSCFCLTILVKHHSDGVRQSAVTSSFLGIIVFNLLKLYYKRLHSAIHSSKDVSSSEWDASRSSWKLLQLIHCHNMQIEYCFYLVKAMD